MNNNQIVSVVIPAYNASAFICKTLLSVLEQSFNRIEVIVVDDGSVDETVSLVNGFGNSVKCICNPHLGKSASRNAGIRIAKGEYIAFVDADDIWLPDKLELQLEMFYKNPDLYFVYTDGYQFRDNSEKNIVTFGKISRLHSGHVLSHLLLEDFIPSPTPLIRLKIFDEVGLFDETLLQHEPEDWDMWLRIAERHQISYVDRPLVRYRLHTNSLTAKEAPLKALNGQISIIDRALARNIDKLKPFRNRAYANCYLRTGRQLASMGNLKNARQMFRTAVQLSPYLAEGYLNWIGCLIGGWPLRAAINMRRWIISK